MKCIKIISFVVCMAAVTSFTSCSQKVSAQPVRDENRTFAASGKMGGRGGMSGSGNSAETMKITSENAVDLSLLTGDEKKVSDIKADSSLYLNLSDLSYSKDGSSYEALAYGEEVKVSDGISIKVSQSQSAGSYVKVSSSDSTVKVVLSGTLKDGNVEIEPKKNSTLLLELDGASISSLNYAPINVSKASQTYLVLTGKNVLNDGRQYGRGYSEVQGVDYYSSDYSGEIEEGAEVTKIWEEGSDTKGSLYTKGSLIISGNGSLDVNEGYKHGIYSKDYIHLISGTVNVTTTGRNCIRSQNGFVMEGGTLNLNGTGTHTNDQSRGIVVEGDEENPGEGFIYITDGNVNINTTGKAISAKWDIEEDAETESTDDDPKPVVVITGGNFDITTSGQVIDDEWSGNVTYYDSDGIEVTEKESSSPEGIEGKLGVIIEDGNFVIRTTDDSINASRDGGAFVNISGGKIYASSSRGDCIDSNGDINISGGTLVALSTLGSEDGFDCDGDLTFTGGVAAGISGASKSYASNSNKNNSQNVFVLGSSLAGKAGTTMAVEDSSGKAVFAFTIPSGISYGLVTISSPNLETGKTYSVKSGVTVSGGENYYGLYTSMPSVSGGSGDTSISTEEGSFVYSSGAAEGGFGRFGMGGARAGDGNFPPDGFNPDMMPEGFEGKGMKGERPEPGIRGENEGRNGGMKKMR
ncbi:MAG: carbohydrate-binding domain-containing protein [Treponema sp.]|nr:carbohydrate-binding domain-containing protein [Treponema sp.]